MLEAKDKLDQKLKALEAFKDWSNYLLIATVAALEWTAKQDSAPFCNEWMKSWAILLPFRPCLRF